MDEPPESLEVVVTADGVNLRFDGPSPSQVTAHRQRGELVYKRLLTAIIWVSMLAGVMLPLVDAIQATLGWLVAVAAAFVVAVASLVTAGRVLAYAERQQFAINLTYRELHWGRRTFSASRIVKASASPGEDPLSSTIKVALRGPKETVSREVFSDVGDLQWLANQINAIATSDEDIALEVESKAEIDSANRKLKRDVSQRG